MTTEFPTLTFSDMTKVETEYENEAQIAALAQGLDERSAHQLVDLLTATVIPQLRKAEAHAVLVGFGPNEDAAVDVKAFAGDGEIAISTHAVKAANVGDLIFNARPDLFVEETLNTNERLRTDDGRLTAATEVGGGGAALDPEDGLADVIEIMAEDGNLT